MTTTRKLIPAFAAALLGLSAVSAHATEGYFQNGYGARAKALAGAGVADSRDATAPAINPAGLAGVSTQINAAFTLFSPRREFTGSSALPAPFSYGFTPLGTTKSGREWHLIPNFAFAYQLDEDSSVGLMVIGNGGMNTSWAATPRTLVNGPCPLGTFGSGTYCMGESGVDLMQMMVGATYARRMGALSFGITPMFAMQRFRAQGLQAFAAASLDPGDLLNDPYDYSYGGGLRAGIEIDVTDRLRLGFAGQTQMWMTKFDKYSGLFANGGKFDIPANITVGAAFDVSKEFRVMVDYKHIFYGSVDAISNPSTNILTCGIVGTSTCLGGSNGAGFGWDDVDIFKIGVEWDATPDLTLRAGYSYNTNPIDPRDVMFNILAPGVVQHHITGGLEYDLNENHSIELAGSYVPETKVSGAELPGFGNPAHNVDIAMHQFELTVGYKYTFNPPKPIMDDPVYKH
ncbi:MAG: hydrocarbon degradation protein [Hyphomicrobiales bacterium]|nr:MAG: hydrocarbon degradation protein [Hyphomicrobiales bacterium]